MKTESWKDRYNREVERMTAYYEEINSTAPVHVRKITPDELHKFNCIAVKSSYLQ